MNTMHVTLCVVYISSTIFGRKRMFYGFLNLNLDMALWEVSDPQRPGIEIKYNIRKRTQWRYRWWEKVIPVFGLPNNIFIYGASITISCITRDEVQLELKEQIKCITIQYNKMFILTKCIQSEHSMWPLQQSVFSFQHNTQWKCIKCIG